MSHLNYEKSLLLLPTPLPKRSLFSIQICHSSQQTTPEGCIWRKEMADTATHQRSSRQNHCEIPLHNHREIASQIEVNAKCFEYRSSWNTLLGAITRETYLSAVCFVLLFSLLWQNFWQKQLTGGMAYICSWFQLFPFVLSGKWLGHSGSKIHDNSWSHSVTKDQEAESTGRTLSRQNLQGTTFPLLTCFPHSGLIFVSSKLVMLVPLLFLPQGHCVFLLLFVSFLFF